MKSYQNYNADDVKFRVAYNRAIFGLLTEKPQVLKIRI